MLVQGRIGSLWLLVAIWILVAYFVVRSRSYAERKVEKYKLRRMAGLDAIDEAIGRATETGRPVHYTIGWGRAAGLSDPESAPMMLSGITLLGYVAERTARLKAPLMVTVSNPETIPLHEEMVAMAYKAQNMPPPSDAVRYYSSYQLAYAAGVMSALQTERAAASIMIGSFFAESLMFAEVGAVVGSIQVAGTARITQIPFFVACCDYVLIGEEIYAASAYVSKDPILVGSIVGQDFSKLLIVVLITIGAVLTSLGVNWVNVLLKL